NGLALFIKAQLLLSAGDDEHAQQLLELAAALDPPEPKVLRTLGKQYFDAAKMDQAEAMYRRGRQAEPNDPAWLEDLARVYKQTGDAAKRVAVLEELAPTDADNLPMRRELAERLAQPGGGTAAKRGAGEGLREGTSDDDARRTTEPDPHNLRRQGSRSGDRRHVHVVPGRSGRVGRSAARKIAGGAYSRRVRRCPRLVGDARQCRRGGPD